jgi:hypothetical protein
MHDLYNKFVKGRLGNKVSLTKWTIEIRLVYVKNDIVCILSFLLIENLNDQHYVLR